MFSSVFLPSMQACGNVNPWGGNTVIRASFTEFCERCCERERSFMGGLSCISLPRRVYAPFSAPRRLSPARPVRGPGRRPGAMRRGVVDALAADTDRFAGEVAGLQRGREFYP